MVSINAELHLWFIQNDQFFPWAYLEQRGLAKGLSFDKLERRVNRMASSFCFYVFIVRGREVPCAHVLF